MLHFIIVGLLVIAMAVLTYFGLISADLLPVQASAQAVPIDWLFNWQFIAISFLFALIVVPLFYSLIVFRRKKGDTSDGEHIKGNTPLEIAWTVIPLFIVIAFAFMGAKSLGDTRRIDPNAMEIKVTASQFSFLFEYPEYGVTSKELYLPSNKQVVLKMESKDVIHSFWVPEFRVKQDIVPGRVTEYRITPTLEGVYYVRCAELCGGGHSAMRSAVEVVTQNRFEQWIAERQAEAVAVQETPEGRGQLLVSQNGCLGCHTTDGSVLVGPSWKGILGEEVELADGTTLIADQAYIAESITDPNVKIVKGFQADLMPQFDFTDSELADIVAYLATLK